MKILYISNYHELSGYSQSALDHILCLDSVGVEVVCRRINMISANGGNNPELPERVKTLEQGDLLGVDCCIQHSLPSEFVYKGGVKNVGIFHYETDNFKNSGWDSHLNLMDQIIVHSEFQKKAIIKTCGEKIANKVDVICHPVDYIKYHGKYDGMDFGVPKNSTVFYNIGENNRRKNLAALLTCYYSAFSSQDNVLLVVKSSGEKEVKSLAKEIKNTLGRFSNESGYPQVALITDRLKQSQINSLHVSSHCYVSLSHGETPCLPYIDAAGFGNATIIPHNSSFPEAKWNGNWYIDCQQSTVFGVKDAPKGLYTTSELWGNPNISTSIRLMQEYHFDHSNKINDPDGFTGDLLKERQMDVRDNYDYQVVGEKLVKLLGK